MKVIIEGPKDKLESAIKVFKNFGFSITDENGEPFFKKSEPLPLFEEVAEFEEELSNEDLKSSKKNKTKNK